MEVYGVKKMTEIKKIILCGEGGVGRSTLLIRYLEGYFSPDTKMTIGLNVGKKELDIEERSVNLVFFDLSGQKRFREAVKPATKGADGAILAFDLTRYQTFQSLDQWVSFLRDYNPHIPILLVGMKLDLRDQIQVYGDYIEEKVEELELFRYIKVSAQTGEHVEVVFDMMARKTLGLELPEIPELSEPLIRPETTYRFRARRRNPKKKIRFPEITQKDIQNFIQGVIRDIKNLYQISNYYPSVKEIREFLLDVSRKYKKFLNLDNLKTEIKIIHEEIQKELDHPTKQLCNELKTKISAQLTPHMNCFIINDFLKLKLENQRTMIYVKNKKFTHCKFLLMNIPVKKIKKFDHIDSIDEAAEILDGALEHQNRSDFSIKPGVEFWGHCSNLQTWAEHDYDTRILHRNLAFPLLRQLTRSGDLKAQKALKEEVAYRFSSGHYATMMYLLEQGYLKMFNEEEINTLIESVNLKKLLGGTSKNIETIRAELRKLGQSHTQIQNFFRLS